MRWPAGVWLLGAAVAACGGRGPDRAHVEALFLLDATRPLAGTDAASAAGAALFEARLGRSACSDCHPRVQRGQDARVHGRDTPALLDVARQALFGRDGRHASLAACIEYELAEHHGIADDDGAAAAVAAQPALAARFEGPVTRRSLAAMLAAHLATWRSRGPWDRYVEGDDDALAADERAGVAAFVAAGCAACHRGRNLGGASLHKLGAAVPYPSPDHGRELATGDRADRDMWKAPMLRHAAATAPYLHDGSVAELDEMVRRMAWHELGKQLAPAEVRAITTMLAAVAAIDDEGPPPARR